jgi:hypothetical protein
MQTLGRKLVDAINAIDPTPGWTVLDRLVRAQNIDWRFRSSEQIAQLLSAAGHPATSAEVKCFGEDHWIPGNDLDRVARGLRCLHAARSAEIQGGDLTKDFNGFRIFARAYLGSLMVPAYGRSPRDVLPLVIEHCLRWHRVLRCLSGVK